MDWDDYKYFMTVAEAGSVRNAAAVLGVHASTVTRRLDQLERRLGIMLFHRTSAGLSITPEGADAMAGVRDVAEALARIERRLHGRDQRLSGRIRLTLPDALAVAFLMEDMVAFHAEHPDVIVEYIPGYRSLDLFSGEADIAIRITDKPPEDLVGRQVGEFAVSAYAHTRLLRTRASGAFPEGAHWIDWAPGTPMHEMSRRIHQEHFAELCVRSQCDNALVLHAAVRAGMGVSLLPCGLVDHDNDLVRMPDAPVVRGGQLWLLTHPDYRGLARVQALMQVIQHAFERNAELLAGKTRP